MAKDYSGGMNFEFTSAGKQPQGMEQPEPEPRNRIVVARVTEVEKSQELLVDEVKP